MAKDQRRQNTQLCTKGATLPCCKHYRMATIGKIQPAGLFLHMWLPVERATGKGTAKKISRFPTHLLTRKRETLGEGNRRRASWRGGKILEWQRHGMLTLRTLEVFASSPENPQPAPKSAQHGDCIVFIFRGRDNQNLTKWEFPRKLGTLMGITTPN